MGHDALSLAVNDTVRAVQEFQEGLIRAHFANTPIALACIERLRIMPWDIELLTQESPIERVPEADPEHRFKVFLETKALVVEHLPRRWLYSSPALGDTQPMNIPEEDA